MYRTLQGSIALIALCAAVPALAADYTGFQEMRPAYAQDWGTGDETLQFEAGVRYWYSIGNQEHSVDGFTETMDTRTNSGEAFVRIDDKMTSTYVEATGGYGVAHDGSFNAGGGPDVDLPAARLGYIGADFGWLPFGNETTRLGFVTGYQYTNDSPDTGRANYTTAETAADIAWSDDEGWWSVGGDSQINNFDIHEAKIGLAGRADFGAVDLTGEATVTPYAWVNGTYGSAALGPQGPFGGNQFDGINPTTLQASETTINGHAYGASGKLLVGFHPTENLTIRVGGRASYLQGAYDATYETATISDPTRNPDVVDAAAPGGLRPADPQYSAPVITRQSWISDNNPFSMFRYGALLEVSGRF